MTILSKLPENLPAPVDDGACRHLLNLPLPDLALNSTNTTTVNPSLINGWQVIYCYPMTGRPNMSLPQGWDDIPGARGCTPQSCNFRDNFAHFKQLKVEVFGLSTQSSEYQQEASSRLHLPYLLLSDEKMEFTSALNLPTFQVEGRHLIKRLTLIAYDGIIKHCFYPVFPPDKNADDVLNWLESHV